MKTRLVMWSAAALLALSVFGGVALAAPANAKKAQTFDLVCDNGQTYPIVVNGNGEWSPGHILNSVGVLIPISFEFHGTFTDADGNEFPVDELSAKGNGKAGQKKTLITCTFEILDVGPSGETFEAVGTVVGYAPGKPS